MTKRFTEFLVGARVPRRRPSQDEIANIALRNIGEWSGKKKDKPVVKKKANTE